MKKKLDKIPENMDLEILFPDSMLFLDELIKAGKVPQAVVVANTKKKEELYNTEE